MKTVQYFIFFLSFVLAKGRASDLLSLFRLLLWIGMCQIAYFYR